MSRFAMRSECLVERVGGYRPVRRMPDGLAVFDDNRLRRFMPDLEAFRNAIRQAPIFDDKYYTGKKFGSRFRKTLEVGVDVTAYRALRAMLENKNRIGFRPLENFIEISIFAQHKYHVFRVPDRCAPR